MSKNYPYPEDLLDREIKRKNAPSERLKRMTDMEEKDWEQEALKIAMKFMVDEKIKPTFPVLKGNVVKQAAACDTQFEEKLLEFKNTQCGKNNPGL